MTAVVLTDRLVALPALPTRIRSGLLVLGGALLTAACAQLTFHLPWTPVPITGQTFAVLITGGALGWRRGSLSMSLYVIAGALGLPFYAEATDGSRGGWDLATGPTAGYLMGFVIAAAVIGWLAEREQDRRFYTSVPAMLAGTAVIYCCGVAWLVYDLNVDSTTALELGLVPFVIGDAIKLVLAGALMPLAWRLTGDR